MLIVPMMFVMIFCKEWGASLL